MIRRKSFDDFAASMGLPSHTIGAWFFVDEAILITESGNRFSNKDGMRNAVLVLVSGPNSRILARSTKENYGGFQHPRHEHLPRSQNAGSCRVNKLGYVALNVPVIVRSSALNEEVFACYEADDSNLLDELRKLSNS